MKKILKEKARKILPESIYSMLARLYSILVAVCGGVINIPFLVISVGQACNFKCRDCGNFAPYSPVKFRRYGVCGIIEDLNQLLMDVTCIQKIQIQGGEPFLYTDLPALLEYLGYFKKTGKIKEIEVATNGSIIPNEKVMSLLHIYDIGIRISDYGIVQGKSEILKKKCSDFSVNYRYYRFVGNGGFWYDLGGIKTLREENDDIVRERYKKCGFRGCLTLERGELSRCSRATNSHIIQGFERKNMDFIKVTDQKDFKRNLKRYIIFPRQMEACRYCYGTDDARTVRPAIQMTEDDGNSCDIKY